jgi:ABC-type antimicrobial peptide transport system permease subunit
MTVPTGGQGHRQPGVTQRRSELGPRRALGAQRASIVSLVVREALGFVLIGIAVDTVLSLASGQVIAALTYETSPYDPRVLVGVALLLSCFAWSRRGSHVVIWSPTLGGRGRVSEVLTGKRALTLAMIRKLHAGLGIPLESLIGPAAPRRRTRRVA